MDGGDEDGNDNGGGSEQNGADMGMENEDDDIRSVFPSLFHTVNHSLPLL